MHKLTHILIALSFIGFPSFCQEFKTIKNLRGEWKFSIGDQEEWKQIDYNDSEWDKIRVPGAWEDQGYHGYDGFAWYRKTIELPHELKFSNLYLELGYIDDVDEVFVNGELIGSSGSFHPQMITAYMKKRVYTIPTHLLSADQLVISVRTFDSHMKGGIVKGNIRLLTDLYPIEFDIQLEGTWKFRTGNNMDWVNIIKFDDKWKDIQVPGHWENNGYENYDGVAWYAIQINPNKEIVENKPVLVLGKIDDIDQVYINGKLIAGTGVFKEDIDRIEINNEYDAFRGYYIPDGVLNANTSNMILVRVYDGRLNGGMYRGPVGMLTQDKYIDYWRMRKELSTKR